MPNERQLTLHTPAQFCSRAEPRASTSGNQALLVRRIEGREGLSQLFTYDVTLYAKSENVKFSEVLGHEMCVGLELPRGGERFFHGYVASFASLGSEGEYTVYRAELRPHLWRLTRSTNCRIFQNVTVPEIVEGILREYQIDIKPDHDGGNRKVNYLPWNYCVQYRETDFAFISRLLEQEGLHYYFRHEKDKHTLVLADSNVSVKAGAIKNYEKVEYTRANNMMNRRDGAGGNPPELIWDFRITSSVLPDRVTLLDYDFRTPKEPLGRDSGSEVNRDHGRATPSEYEVYDPLETVVQQDGYSAELTADYARIRAEEAHVRYAVASAQTDARGLCAGAVVSLLNGPEASKNIHYLILGTELSAELDVRSSSAGGASGSGVLYQCWYEAIDHKHPYRPPRVTPKPVIPGPQSAIVSGPEGSGDIATDEWGRIFVKFHWARKLKAEDKDLSCWVRVSQNSAGANWGSMFIPHIGQEVLVGFIEGDPDRPVVIGKVYNGLNKPPLTLPDYKYKSILRDHYGNEIIFDGTPGSEHMAFHSPSHDSVMMLGKSSKQATKHDRVTASLNKKTYALGNSESYTRGNAFTLKKGTNTSIDLGVKTSLVAGTEFKMAASAQFELKVGTSMTYALSTALSWGYGTEIRKTKGGYTQMSSKDAILDSKTKTIVSGGARDFSMLESSDHSIALSFDKSATDRAGALKAADRAMTAAVAVMAGNTAVLSALGKFSYDAAKYDAKKNVDGSISDEAEADLDEFTGWSAGDIATVAAAGSSLAGGLAPFKFSIPAPQHPSPSAKVVLSEDEIRLFAGDKEESKLSFHKTHGITMAAKGPVAVSSPQNGISIEAAKDISVKSSTQLKISANINHPNFKVSL
jgi:type VI secretion system secreted protein VgrG